MEPYKIIGMHNEMQASRIKGRFCDALKEDIKLDYEHSSIFLPDNIDPYTISLISSFEQVSIVKMDNLLEELHIEEDNHDGHQHHHHEHVIKGSKSTQRNMMVVFFINLIFSFGEFIFGTILKSQAILSDAIHDLGDALSIGLAYFFEKISNKSASNEYSYGYRRFSLLGALVTSIVLIVGAILITIQTIPVLFNPVPVNHEGVFWVAIAAILMNGFSVWLMSKGQSANEKLLNIHLFEDLFGWVAVLLMSIILNFTEWYIIDPLLSLVIAFWILYVTIPEFLRISKIFLQAVPDGIDVQSLREEILKIEHIQVLSHFHIWSTDGQQHMMTLTVTTDTESKFEQEEIKLSIRDIVLKHNISHITIEILYDPNNIIKESIDCEC